jgi:hypothetical protein
MDQLTLDRIRLVRMYHVTPSAWPDGIDWGSRWYTTYWDALARGETVTETKTVTETPVTKTPRVTKTPPVTKTVTEVKKVVSRLKVGRPKKDGALSAKERMQAYRKAHKSEKP